MEPIGSPIGSSSLRRKEKSGRSLLSSSLTHLLSKLSFSSSSSSSTLSSSHITSPRGFRKSPFSKRTIEPENKSQSHLSILLFASKYPKYTTQSPQARRYSEKEIKEAALIELRHRVVEKLNQDTNRLIKKRLSQGTFEAMGTSVNHVFPIDDDSSDSSETVKKGKIAYLKCSRDGMSNSSIMERAISGIVKELDLSNFVESNIMYISPRSGEQLVIPETTDHPKLRRRSSSLTKHFLQSTEKQAIGVTVSKAVEGKTLKEIYLKDGNTLFNHYASIQKEVFNGLTTREAYRLQFIESVLNSIVIGTGDAHRGNVILTESGFYHLDHGRSAANSNMLLIWGDSLKLPYHSAFQMEKDFFSDLSEKELEYMSTFIKSLVKKTYKLETFMFHPIQKKGEGIDRLPPGWLFKKSTCEAIRERILRIDRWLKEKEKSCSLDDLMQYVFPCQSLVTCLYAATKIFPNYFLQHENAHDKKALIEEIWQRATEYSGKFQNQRDPIDGKIHDLLHLLDQYAEIGLDLDDLWKTCLSKKLKSSAPAKELLVRICDFISSKQNECPVQKNNVRLKEIKLYLCKQARIDFKEITNNDYWFVQYLHRLCEIGESPCLSNEFLPPFSVDKNEEFTFKAFSILNDFFAKGYCFSFYELENDEKNPNLLEVGCSISYLDSDGKLVKNNERLTVGVIEGEIFVFVRDGSNQYMVPFLDFVKEIETRFFCNKKFNPDCPENLLYAQRLFPLEYFISLLTKEEIDFFNYDEFDITDEFYREINDFILFFKRCYILKKDNDFFLKYLDNTGTEKSLPLNFKREELTIHCRGDIFELKGFSRFLRNKMSLKQFEYGAAQITIEENNAFTMEKDGVSIKGKFNPSELKIELLETMTLEEFKAFLCTNT